MLLSPGPYLGEPLFPAIGSQASGGGNAALITVGPEVEITQL